MHIEAKQLKRKVKSILDSYQHGRETLVSILQDIQAEYNYLSEEVLV